MNEPINKLKNGMIAFIDGSISDTSKKWLDIEITNTFPLIALPKTLLVLPNGQTEEIDQYDHVSIPPDLRIHVSSKRDKIFFNVTQAFALRDGQTTRPIRLFTFVDLPIKFAPFLYGPKTKVWDEVLLISPQRDSKFNPDTTRMFIDFFIHKNSYENTINSLPFAHKNMRLAQDNSGSLIGPFRFEELQRKFPTEPDLLFTIRFGFVELNPEDKAYLFMPFEIYQRRENQR